MIHCDHIFLLVAGSRTLDTPVHRGMIFQELDRIITALDPYNVYPVTIVSGGARGVDTFAEDYAVSRCYGLNVLRANWDKHGKTAGFIRNVQMLNMCTHVVAFLNKHGKSNGTRHTISKAKEMNIPLVVIEL